MTTQVKESAKTPTHATTPLEEMERFSDLFLRRNWPAVADAIPFQRVPKIDVINRDGEILMRAEIPGVDKNNIDIAVGEDSVTVSGSTRREEKEEQGDYYRHELTTGSFSRTVGLPAAVDGAKAKATFKDGLLELTLPKTQKTTRHGVKID